MDSRKKLTLKRGIWLEGVLLVQMDTVENFQEVSDQFIGDVMEELDGMTFMEARDEVRKAFHELTQDLKRTFARYIVERWFKEERTSNQRHHS